MQDAVEVLMAIRTLVAVVELSPPVAVCYQLGGVSGWRRRVLYTGPAGRYRRRALPAALGVTVGCCATQWCEHGLLFQQ